MCKQPSIRTDRKPAETWESLAGQLETTSRSLRGWRQRPGAPAEPDLEQWRDYVAEHGLGRVRSGELGGLKAELLRQQIAKARRENEIAAGKMIDKDSLAELLRDRVLRFAQILQFTLEVETPGRLIGANAAECRVIMRDVHDRIAQRWNSGLGAEAIISEATGGAATGQDGDQGEN